jgi:hypothetical protein
MDGISLQCGELLFRDGFADDQATEVIVLHLVSTLGSCGAGLGEVPFGALKTFWSGELEELIDEDFFSGIAFAFSSHDQFSPRRYRSAVVTRCRDAAGFSLSCSISLSLSLSSIFYNSGISWKKSCHRVTANC